MSKTPHTIYKGMLLDIYSQHQVNCTCQRGHALASKASIRKRGTNAVYNTNDDNAMNGMRVKFTFTFSGLGNVMPIVVTVSGLTEREMPNGLDFIDAKVPGLSGGKRDGYLLFMRNTKGAHVERAKWYQENILFPGIANDRKKYASNT